MKGKKIVSYALATIMTMQGGGLVFANDNNDYIAKELARINAEYNVNYSPVKGFDYNSLSLDKIKNSIKTLELGIQKNNNIKNEVTEIKVPSSNNNANYLQKHLDELNAKYNVHITIVEDFDYNILTIEQIDHLIKNLEEYLISIQNNFKNNITNISVSADANGNVSLPKEIISTACPISLIYLSGAVDYTSEHDKSLGNIFKSIDSVNTWTIAEFEIFVNNDWKQKNFRSNIYNRGKRAQVDITGILSASYLWEGAPLHFDQEINKSYDLSF